MRYIVIFITLFFLLPATSLAASHGGIVPDCGYSIGNQCSFADLVQLGMNILNFIVVFAISITAIMFAIAGFLYFSDGGNEKNITTAHTIFTSVVIGLVIILTAWLIVNTLLLTLTGDSLDKRNQDIPQKPSTNSYDKGNTLY